MKGRPRKPTKLHILDGTFREDRHGGNEPEPLAGIADCPKHLGKDARRVWKELVRVMGESGVLTQADQWIMARFCSAAVRMWRHEARMDAIEEVETADEIQAEANDAAVKRMYVIIRGETEALRAMAAELGLTPAARTKLGVTVEGSKPIGVSTRDRSKGFPPPAAK